MPVVAYVIFKALLHWKAFATNDKSFVNIIVPIEQLTIVSHSTPTVSILKLTFPSYLTQSKDSKMLYYWCSVNATLLYLFREQFAIRNISSPRGLMQCANSHDLVDRKLSAMFFSFYTALLKLSYEVKAPLPLVCWIILIFLHTQRLERVVVPAIMMQNTLSGG